MLFPYSTDAPIYHWPIAALVDEGNIPLALAANARLANQYDDWVLPERVLVKLLAVCIRKNQDADPVPFAVEYLPAPLHQGHYIRGSTFGW